MDGRSEAIEVGILKGGVIRLERSGPLRFFERLLDQAVRKGTIGFSGALPDCYWNRDAVGNNKTINIVASPAPNPSHSLHD